MKRGDRVLLTLQSNEVFEGTIERISSKNVEITDVFCQHKNAPYEGDLSFYRDEVVSIRTLTKSNSEDVLPVNGELLSPTERIKMDPDEFDRLKRMTFNFAFINSTGKSFDDAIETLTNRESVGVVGLGSISRSTSPSLLVMADFKQVYIFDLTYIGLGNLKDILESPHICKVIHGGIQLNDCLYYKHGVQMNNVFDTQIVDSLLSEENGNACGERNLSECLMHHFNFPSSLLSAAIEGTNTWKNRPLTKGEKITAAQLATYLLTIRDVLLSRILKKYTDPVAEKYKKYRDTNDSNLINFRLC